MPNEPAELDNVFRALADGTRRRVLHRLSVGRATVSELAQPFDMALPSFVQHLRVLEDAGLIRSEKRGRVRTCEIVADALEPAEAWIGAQRSYWAERLDALQAYVERGGHPHAPPTPQEVANEVGKEDAGQSDEGS